jgi:hypothetical protein
MKSIVRDELMDNGYAVVVQDQWDYHGGRYSMGHEFIKYKVIVLAGQRVDCFGRMKTIYGIVKDTNCSTMEEADAQVDRYIHEYENKIL